MRRSRHISHRAAPTIAKAEVDLGLKFFEKALMAALRCKSAGRRAANREVLGFESNR
jgi:hypothetical protein